LTGRTLSFEYEEAIPRLQLLGDVVSHKIILATIDIAKTAQQIALENNLPVSSTYKKIRRLCQMDLLCVDQVNIDESGKKVLFYKSKVKSLEFYLKKGACILQFEKNEHISKFNTPIVQGSNIFSSENLNRP
jgi:allophanate hydrolase subunit 2